MSYLIKAIIFSAVSLWGFSVQAATIVVDNGTSTVATDAVCSIREAIENSNDNAATNVDCVAGSGTDTIDIQTDIVLTVVDHSTASDFAVPAITDAVILDGNGHSISRSGVTSFGFTDFSAAVTLTDLTISDFSQIVLKGDGPLTVSDSVFSNNSEAVFYTDFGGSAHPWSITDSEFSGNSSSGRGIVAKEDGGLLTISGSTFSDNTNLDNFDGSAVRYTNGNSGETVSISDSIFSNNVYTTGGCGAFGLSASQDVNIQIDNTVFDSNVSEFCGGAISVESGFAFATISLDITNSLFKNNSASETGDGAKSGGAIYVQNGMNLTLTNNTFFGNSSQVNGGAIQVHNEAGVIAIEAKHNTFYGNSSADGDGNDIYVETGAGNTSVFENNIFASGGDECGGDLSSFTFTNNLSTDSDCGGTAVTFLASSLSMSGGSTETLALLAGSNAINNGIAGTLGCPGADARGVARPSGSGCDIGAFEFVNSAPTDISISDSSIKENKSAGTAVGTLSATDADTGDTFIYSLACSTPASDDISFSISGTSLVSAVSFDADEKDSYDVCIRATDTSGGTFDKNFSISIERTGSSSGSSGGGTSGPSNPTTPPVSPITPPAPPVTDPIVPPTNPDPLPEPQPEEPVLDPAPPEDSPIEPAFPDYPNTPSVEDNNNVTNNNSDGVVNNVSKVLGVIAQEIPDQVAETVAVAGVALPAMVLILSQPAVAVNVVSIPMRLMNLIPIWLGFRRRKRPWGTVYDSVTKQPLDPVYVSLRDMNGKEIATTITDMDGRFGFLVAPGIYTMSASKGDYVFPSKKLSGNTKDELYENLYFSEKIEIKGEEELVIRNIPMDSESFNWNEFEKAKNKRLMKFYSKRELFFARIATGAFWLGLIVSFVMLVKTPSTLNYILCGIYGVVLVLRSLGVKPKNPGYVTEKESGFPLSFGIVKIYSATLGREVAQTVIGKTGKYYALVPNGEYYVKIQKKTGENTYTDVLTSNSFTVKKGYVGKTFYI